MDATKHEWTDWHHEREAELREPYGWLSIVELAWIGATPKELAHFPGVWSAADRLVTFQAPTQGVFYDEVPATGTLTFDLNAGPNTLLTDTLGRKAEIALRFGKVMVRIRDPHAQTRSSFEGVPMFDYSPSWCVTLPWSKYPQPKTVLVPSAQEGYMTELKAFGTVSLNNQDLVVTGDELPTTLIFHDATNGVSTEAWRAAPVTVSGDYATVDFNRCVNFPAHFTEYGTCPTPPLENTIIEPVEAGEKMVLGD